MIVSSSDWPVLPGQKTATATQSKKPWGAIDKRSSEVSTSCDTSCDSDDGSSSRSNGEGDDAGYTSDDGSSWSLSANAAAFVPGGTSDKTRLDAKAAVFVPCANPALSQASGSSAPWHFPIAVRPPPGLADVSSMVQPPPGLRAGLSTKAKAFVPKTDL